MTKSGVALEQNLTTEERVKYFAAIYKGSEQLAKEQRESFNKWLAHQSINVACRAEGEKQNAVD